MSGRSFPIVTRQAREQLEEMNPRAPTDYQQFKTQFVEWLEERGKEPERRKGYMSNTVKQTTKIIDLVFRWMWSDKEYYTTQFSPDDADVYMKFVDTYGSAADTTMKNYVKCIKRYFKYRNDTTEVNLDWSCPFTLEQKQYEIRDHLRQDEFQPLFDAAMNYRTVRSYHSCSPEERDELKTLLSQRFTIPKSEIGPEDFKRANSFKIPSLIAVALDVGIRPIEVERAKTTWFNLNREVMEIPQDDSTKNDENWSPGLSSRTTRLLNQWYDERESYDKYNDSQKVWLTKYGNGYKSKSLNDIFHDLVEKSTISVNQRDLSWYSIRHGVATVWANKFGLEDASQQLRHKKLETTKRYVHSTSEDRSEMADSAY